MNILALCTSNSARSILLEGILNSLGQGGVTAFSAGSHPGGTVHPQALRLLTEHGHDTARARSKSWDIFAEPGAPQMDLVITVCDAAAAETCPFWPGAPLRCHWGVPDPAALPPEAQEAGFNAAYTLLRRRAEALLALSPGAITASELARIGALE